MVKENFLVLKLLRKQGTEWPFWCSPSSQLQTPLYKGWTGPLDLQDWSKRAVFLYVKQEAMTKFTICLQQNFKPHRIFLEMYPHLSLQLHFIDSKPQPLHCCCTFTLPSCHVCCIPLHNVHSVVNERILQSKRCHLLMTHEIMAAISQSGSHDWCYWQMCQ